MRPEISLRAHHWRCILSTSYPARGQQQKTHIVNIFAKCEFMPVGRNRHPSRKPVRNLVISVRSSSEWLAKPLAEDRTSSAADPVEREA